MGSHRDGTIHGNLSRENQGQLQKSENVYIIFGTVLREFTVVDLHMSIFVCSDPQGKK